MAVLRCCALQRPARAANVFACTLWLLEGRERSKRPGLARLRVPIARLHQHAVHWRPKVGLSPSDADARGATPGARVGIGSGAMRIEGCGALVTGGASGLGEATVRHLRERGAVVTIADIDAERGEAIADELGARFVACDVREEDQVQAAVAA